MPTTAYTDGNFVYPSQHGARQVSLPLIQEQEYYCTQTIREMQQLAQFFEPAMYQRTVYTNVLTYSDAASNAAWTKVAVTVAAESSTDPEGGGTASFIAETTANSAHSIAQAATGTGVVTFGAFVKAKERTFVRLRINNGTDGNLAVAIFNLTLGKTESGTGTIKKMPGGWMYCTVSGTATVSGNTCYLELASNASTTSYAGTTGSGLYAWRLNAVFASSVSPTPVTTAATPAIYTDSSPVAATVPLVDWDDPLSFLIDESQPDQSTLELGVCQWQRSFCRVSRQTVTPSSIIISKPAPLGSGSAIMGTDVFFHQPESAYSTYDIYSVTDVDIDQGAPSFAITGGTYTITAGSYTTTSISYNATAGDVQAALNLLPSVITAGLAVVSGSATIGLGFSIIFGSAVTYGTMQINSGSLVTQPLTGSYTVISGSTMPSGAGSGAIGTIEKPFKIFATVENPYAPGAITAGTYTLTYYAYGGATSTTAPLNYDATAADIGTAINNLAAIQAIGGVTMYEWDDSYDIGINTTGQFNGQIVISFYHYSPTLSVDAGQLEDPPITPVVTTVPNSFGKSQHILLIPGNAARLITATDHGFSNGDTAFIEASYVSSTSPVTAYTTTYYVPVTAFEVTGANSLQFTGNPLDGYMTAASITKVGRRVFTGYSPGPQNVKCSKITDYYLPGFTPGIQTAADIPIAESENDGEPFFSAMIAGGDINYAVGELGVWRGPIIYQSTIKVSARDLASYSPQSNQGSMLVEKISVEAASIPVVSQYVFNDFTFEFWCYIVSSPAPGAHGRIVQQDYTQSFAIYYEPNNSINFGLNGVAIESLAAAVTLDQWDHYSFRRQGATFSILKNGVSIKAQSVATTVLNVFTASPQKIDFGGTAENLQMMISDWRMWNRALPDSEIIARYQKRLNGTESGLVGYYPLSQSSNVFSDLTGFNAPVTLTYAYWVVDGPTFSG